MNKLKISENINFYIIVLIILLLWLRFIPHFESLYISVNVFNISGSTIYIEDLLVFIIYLNLFNKFVNTKNYSIIFDKNYFIQFYIWLNLFGLLFILYSISMGNFSNLLSEYRLFFFSIILYIFLSFSKKEINNIIFLISIIFLIDLSYQYLYRINNSSLYNLAKNSFYINRLFYLIAFNAFLYFIFSDIKSRSYMLSVIPLFFLIVILDESRALWLSILLIIFFFALPILHMKVKIIFILIITLVYLFSERINYIINFRLLSLFEMTGSVYGRIQAWTLLIDQIMDNPLFGHGIGSTGHFIDSFFEDKNYEKIYLGTSHNSYLILIYQIGIFGFLIFLMPFFVILKIYLNNVIHSGFSLDSSFALSLISSCLVFSFFTPTSIELYYFYWISASISLCILKFAYD